jgi:hypothetical protein
VSECRLLDKRSSGLSDPSTHASHTHPELAGPHHEKKAASSSAGTELQFTTAPDWLNTTPAHVRLALRSACGWPPIPTALTHRALLFPSLRLHMCLCLCLFLFRCRCLLGCRAVCMARLNAARPVARYYHTLLIQGTCRRMMRCDAVRCCVLCVRPSLHLRPSPISHPNSLPSATVPVWPAHKSSTFACSVK